MQIPDLPKINSDRLWQRHLDLAALGATKAGGVYRLALSAEDIAAYALIADWAGESGFTVQLDAIGNMFICRPGRGAVAKRGRQRVTHGHAALRGPV